MIRAGEAGRLAAIGPAEPIAAVAARVEQSVDRAPAIPHHQDGVFPHRSGEEVPRGGNLTVVVQEQPAAPKDLLQLLLVDRWLDEDPSADQAVLCVHQSCQVCAHDASLSAWVWVPGLNSAEPS